MNLIVYAVPFFILAMIVEWLFGLARHRNTYRLSDSISSLFLGVLSQARRFVTLGLGGYVYYLVTRHFSLPLLDAGDWSTWVLATVLYDLCYYWQHRMGHERTFFWAAHVAHHQSEDYNLSTALRQTSTGFLLDWVFYIPMYLLGIPAEVVVTVGAINLIYQFWVHTEHVPKLGWYEWVFVTPSNHRVHHAQNDIYMDRNYGGIFILWDRLFGTFQEELASEPPIYGIRGPLRSWNPVKALTHIYIDMFRDSWHTRRWRDKLRVWVARTGWRPADVAQRYPRDKPGLAQFRKFDPPVSRLVGAYAFAQLVAAVLLLDFMQKTDLAYWSGFSMWALLLAGMVTTALWLEGRDPVRLLRWELLRLAGLSLLLLAAQAAQAGAGLLLAGVGYGVLNLFFLFPLVREPATSGPAPAQ
ncbi:MAG: sterol desaturase family protein [Gammaproteobacteria bacterium]|nr:sterol desaturase family protein [Gammaproteobacteria bacterium]MDH5171391.1 sterol desaturase family protein [Gammaproteobacteria bacterium]